MSYTNPNIDAFKAYFQRDFVYGSNPSLNVLDSDITKALTKAAIYINQNLFPYQAAYDIGFLNLSAHLMVIDLQSASQGAAGSWDWLISSKSVGNVSTSMAIPDKILAHPLYSYYSKTNYGLEYLMQVFPYMVGVTFTVEGKTLP